MDLISRLEKHRDGRPKTWIARKLEVSTATITSWERQEAYPPYDKARLMAKAYGITMEELYEEVDE